MEEKLRRLMKHEGINSTRLAEILGIQASGISHIMSGRNQPSGAFLMKLLQRFPQINPDWLLLDKGPMYRDEIKNKAVYPSASAPEPAGLFAGQQAFRETERGTGGSVGSAVGGVDLAVGMNGGAANGFAPDNNDIIPAGPGVAASPGQPGVGPPRVAAYPGNFARSASIERIVVFYKDKTFSEYQPGV